MADTALANFAEYVHESSRNPKRVYASSSLVSNNKAPGIEAITDSLLDDLNLRENDAISPKTALKDKSHLKRLIESRIDEGMGECIFELGLEENSGKPLNLTKQEHEEILESVREICQDINACWSILAQEDTTSQLLIRKKPQLPVDILEIRVAVIGNVDAGKSTLLGVLTRGGLDDGRGKARVGLFRHKHELESGRTSSVGMEIMGFDCFGKQIVSSDVQRKYTWHDIQQHAAKIIAFSDLAGHERYLKTTVFGLLGSAPDYCMLIVGANSGMIGMAKEHLGIALALNVPIFVIVTKIDMCPANVLSATLSQLTKILKSPGCRKIPFMIKRDEDVVSAASHCVSQKICPIFQVSNVTGLDLYRVKAFLNVLPFHGHFNSNSPVEYDIMDTFSVPFVGTVVSGTIKNGIVHAGDTLWLGPDGVGGFTAASIRTIQRKRVNVPCAKAGQSATFALRRLRRKDVRKGMVMLSKTDTPPSAVKEFVAECLILYHQSTIKVRYSAMVHCGPVAQTCQICEIFDKPFIRTGDRALVRFRFISHPEYVTPGQKLLFREGKTKGLGLIREVFR